MDPIWQRWQSWLSWRSWLNWLRWLSWFGLVLLLFGLVWFGMVWYGLVWFGLVWFGLVDQVLGGWGHPYHGLHDVCFITCVPNLSSLACLEGCQEPPVLEVHTWRMFMVPYQVLGGWGPP